MGFWDSVAGLAKGAGQAVQEKAKEQQYEMWKKLGALPEVRLVDYIKQNEDRRTAKSLAILALSVKNRSSAQRFIDDDIKNRVVSKCDVLTTYLSCLDCILIKIDARQLHDFLSSWKSLKFSV